MRMTSWPAACSCGFKGKILEWDYNPLICPSCGEEAYHCEETPRFGQAPGIAGDDIPGGIEIRHGLVNADGSPRKFYSKTAIRQAANEEGLTMNGDTPKPYNVRWSGKAKEAPRPAPIIKTK
jgi:hypothetical protein